MAFNKVLYYETNEKNHQILISSVCLQNEKIKILFL